MDVTAGGVSHLHRTEDLSDRASRLPGGRRDSKHRILGPSHFAYPLAVVITAVSSPRGPAAKCCNGTYLV